MKNKSGTKKTRGASDPSQSGIMDDASTTMVASGGTSLTHGVMIDSLTRSAPTQLTSWTTRTALMEFAGNRIPWYNPDATGLNPTGADSVAYRLLTSVNDAEDWKAGRATASNSQRLYSDVPFNPAYMSRLNFYALDPDAAELDPTFQFEPQMFALDEFSQLFAESASFHFGWLADLDNEYHRLRPEGVVGVFNESADDTPWYNLYHYWRDEIRRTYLDTGFVTLPVGALTSNWRIVDVLHELKTLMAPSGDALLPDIMLTAKGVMKGQQTAGFGLLKDERYLDSDGNSRLYVPWMESAFDPDVEGSPGALNTESALSARISYNMPGGIRGLPQGGAITLLDNDSSFNVPASSTVAMTHRTESGSSFASSRAHEYIANVAGLSDAVQASNFGREFSPTAIYGDTIGASFNAQNATADSRFKFLHTITGINDIPMGTTDDPTLTDGYMGQCAYYTGHSLNLHQLIDVARRIGRALEPEVATQLLPAFGAVTSFDALVTSGTGMSAREVPVLYNLYQSGFSFNENPTRTYTAAHLGPSSIELAPGELSLEGIELTTTSRGGITVSARERYWTPTVLGAAAGDISPIMGSMLGGGRFYFGLFGESSLTAAPFLAWSGLDRAYISRALGSTSSMYTKVEKPSILPAGVASAESTYASGVGRGALELVVELVLGSLGSRPRFGLGMAGFSDIRASYGQEPITDVYGNVRNHRTVAPTTRRLAALSTTARANTASTSGQLYGDQMDAIENIVGGRGLREQAFAAGDLDALDDDSFAVVSPSRQLDDTVFTNAGVPAEIISSPAAAMINTKLVELSGLPLRSQWGYFQITQTAAQRVSTFIGSQYAGSSLPNGGHLHLTMYPKDCSFDGSSYALLNEAAPRTHSGNLDAHPTFTSIADTSVWGGNAVFGEPVISAGGNHFISNYNLTNGPNMVVSYPNATPMQLILGAMQGAAPFDWATDAATGRRYVDVSMNMGIKATHSVTTPGGINHYTQEIGAMGPDFIEYQTTYRLSVGPEAQTAWDNVVDITTNGAYDPAIGEEMIVSPLMDLVNSAELTWLSCGAMTHNSSIMQGILAGMDHDGASAAFEALGQVQGEITAVKPPLYTGGMLSEQLQYLLHTPVSLTSTAGTWSDARFNIAVSPEGMASTEITTLPRLSTSPSPYSTASGEVPDGDGSDLPNGSEFHVQAWWEHIASNPGSGFSGALGVFGWSGLQSVDNARVLRNDLGPSIHAAGETGMADFGRSVQVSHVEYNTSGVPAHVNTGIDIPWSQVSFIYPDDPANKMLYRPWRTYVDSAVAKELRMTFLNLGEDVSSAHGPLGIEMIGVPKEFRFAELVRAGPDVARTFILEKATTKTRMVNPDNRGILTFSRISLLDPTSQRHVIADTLREYNTAVDMMSGVHSSGSKGKVYSRDFIRQLQAGRQAIRSR